MMLTWFLALDPTVQVAIIAPLVAALIAIPSGIINHMKPKSEEEAKEYAPKTVSVALEEVDRLRLDRLIYVLESLGDGLERHRVEIAQLRYRTPKE